MPQLKHILVCFRMIATPALIISVSMSAMFWLSDAGTKIIPILWGKLLTSILLLVYVHYFKKDDFFFFHNLGLSNKYIYLSMLGKDMLIFLLIAILGMLI